ncbi:MAG TPA: rod shape-determining protein MreC [Acidimicrobiales bacterium]|nr:rod shape-determining protein MreC [Acidimicrobiales bacterium]
MAVYRRSRRHRFFLVLLALTSVTVLTLDYRGAGDGALESVRQTARDAFAPLQGAADRVVSPVAGFVGAVGDIGSLRSENARLKRELEAARADAIRGADADRERQGLLQLQGLDYAGGLDSVPARVISTAPTNFQLTITIDRGSDARLDVGMPVVTNAGLVGRITEVSKLRATVLLITDPQSNVGVRLVNSGEQGVARGGGARNPLSLDLIAPEIPVEVGEPVVTSGLERGLFPPQIPVGLVRSADAPQGVLQKEIRLEPTVDLLRLEFVRILLWKPSS